MVKHSKINKKNKMGQFEQEMARLNARLVAQDAQLDFMNKAKTEYKEDKDINKLADAYVYIMNSGGFLFPNAGKWMMDGARCLRRAGRFDEAWNILNKVPLLGDHCYNEKHLAMERVGVLKDEGKYQAAVEHLIEAYGIDYALGFINGERFVKDLKSLVKHFDKDRDIYGLADDLMDIMAACSSGKKYDFLLAHSMLKDYYREIGWMKW